jgi:hypothetical protein
MSCGEDEVSLLIGDSSRERSGLVEYMMMSLPLLNRLPEELHSQNTDIPGLISLQSQSSVSVDVSLK